MKQLIVSIFLLFAFVASPSFAANCDNIKGLSGMSTEQQLIVKNACQKALLDGGNTITENVDLTDPKVLSQWGIVAQEFAKALGIAAKELGIAVDEFLGTTAGKLTAGIIIWTVAGSSILGFVVGIPLLITIIVVCRRIAKKSQIKSITYSQEKTTRFGKPLIEKIEHYDTNEVAMYWLAHVAMILLSIMTLGWIIF